MQVVDTQVGGGSTGEKYEYGYHGNEIGNLIQEINTGAVDKAGQFAVDNTSIVTGVAKEYWEGTAEEQFEKILQDDANTFKERVQQLVNAANTDIGNAGVEYQNFDKRLMDEITS